MSSEARRRAEEKVRNRRRLKIFYQKLDMSRKAKVMPLNVFRPVRYRTTMSSEARRRAEEKVRNRRRLKIFYQKLEKQKCQTTQ